MGAVIVEGDRLKVITPTGSINFGFDQLDQIMLLQQQLALGAQELRIEHKRRRGSKRRPR